MFSNWYRRYSLLAVCILYFSSSLIQVPAKPQASSQIPHWRIGSIVISHPLVLSGDSPHYLVVVNSLIEDLDFDVSNNYQQARDGDWDAGARFRGVELDHHTDRDRLGRELSTHSPFFPILLAGVVWPLRGTRWVEPACIWLTLLVALAGLALFWRHVGQDSKWMLLLALGTSLWCYSRDLWTEPWILTIWIAMLLCKNPVVVAGLALVGTMIKYPFAVVPMTIGLVALNHKDYRRGWSLLLSGIASLILVVLVIQHLFRDVNHFSLFHSGVHDRFSWPFRGAFGLLLWPGKGILWFFPYLAWGLWQFRRAGEIYLPAVIYFLVHASYEGWAGGTGFSVRYLVPMLPIMVSAIRAAAPAGWFFRLAVVFGLFWGFLGGLLPALVYDRTPWGVFWHVIHKIF